MRSRGQLVPARHPVAECLVDIRCADPLASIEIGDRASHPKNAVVAAAAEKQAPGHRQQASPHATVNLNEATREAGIHLAIAGSTKRPEALALPLSRRHDPLAHLGRGR